MPKGQTKAQLIAALAAAKQELGSLRRQLGRTAESGVNYEILFRDSQAIMLLINPENGAILDANDSALHYYGYPYSQIIKMRISDLNVLPEEAIAAEMAAAKSDQRTYFRFQHRSKDGTIHPVEVYSGGINLKGKTLLLSTIHDVTQRRSAEHELINDAEKYRLIVENAHDGIEITQLDRFMYTNHRFAEMLGYTVAELQNVQFSKVFNQQALDDLNIRNAQRQQSGNKSGNYVSQLLAKDGRIVDVDVHYEIINYKGEPATFAIIRDISEKLTLEAQLRQAQKLEAMGTMVGGIAHEFNNILQSMFLYVEVLRSQLSEQSELLEDLQHLSDDSERARKLVQQILIFSRKSEVQYKPQKIHASILDALSFLRASSPPNIKIIQSIDTDCSAVLCDQTQIYQIVVNLGNNARQAIGQAQGVIACNMRCVNTILKDSANETECLELTVSDTGPGMDAATQERIFDPFFTTKDIGRGTGLGLSMIYGIVEIMKGQIKVFSKPGEGTTFMILIPTVDQTTTQYLLSEEAAPILESSLGILLVDDEEDIRRASKTVLNNAGHYVVPAADGAEALALFLGSPEAYDLIIIDQAMPKLAGDDLALAIRQHDREIPIILSSGNLDTAEQRDYRQKGVDYFLQKPWTPKQLIAAVAKVLQKRRKSD